jgi:hypothetical protein
MEAEINDLVGKTMTNVEHIDYCELIFTTTEGERYRFYHDYECCESVTIDDIVGDLSDLAGEPILLAEEVSNNKSDTENGSCTWTFYKFATRKGYVDVRWYGTSNGYYSESVNFEKMED